MDKMLMTSLDWIREIANPDAYFVHPNDENKVKCASRALYKMGITINRAEVVDYCRRINIPQRSINKIIDWYSHPQGLRLKKDISFTPEGLKSIWENMILDNQ